MSAESRSTQQRFDQAMAAQIASTDQLMAAAQGMAARIHTDGTTTTLGCSCGAVSQTVAPHSFDAKGRLEERTLWAVVAIIEHCLARGDSHSVTPLVVAK